MGRVAYGLVLALFLALWSGAGGGTGGAGRSTAWASAAGDVLHYEVYDREITPRDWQVKLPHEQSFIQAVRDWAQANQIPFSDGGRIDAPRCIRLNTGGVSGSMADGITLRGYDVTLVGITDAEREGLIEQLAPLPGVAPPVLSDYPQYGMLTGMPAEHAPGRVLINGTAYNYPQDFSPEETSALRWFFASGRDYTRYYAFKTLGSGPPLEADRFGLGDVFRAELNAAGDVELTTVVPVWEEGRVLQNDPLFQERLGNRGLGSWSVAMSRELPEPGYDPLQALAASGDRRAEQAHALDYPLRTEYTYQLFPVERMLSASAPKYTPEEAAQAMDLVAQLEASLDEFQLSHPQYWNKVAHRYRVSHGCSYFGTMPLLYHVSVAASDAALAQEVQAVLAAVPGLPEPQVAQRDLQKDYKAMLQQVALPFTGEDFDLPPLPPPNPAQWHALQGYKLTYRVLGRQPEGQRYYGETDAARAFSRAVARWATDSGVPVNPQPEAVAQPPVLGPSGAPVAAGRPVSRMQFPEPALYVAEPGGAGQFGGFAVAVFSLYLAAPDDALPDGLRTALQTIAGVAEPSVEACRFYIHDAHPRQPVTGGDLVVDGRRYRFPDDFAWEEALSVSYLLAPPGHVQYKAFLTLVDPQRNRIKFPDVVRLEHLPDGSTALTAYKQEWPEGRARRDSRPGVYGGPTVELPPDVAEGSFDPLPGLGAQLGYHERTAPGAVSYQLYYNIVPQDQWLVEYTQSASADAAQQRRAIYDEMDRRLTAWLAAHPDCIETDTTWQRVSWYSFPYNGSMLGAAVVAYSDDAALIEELAALLADIPGLPEPLQAQESMAQGDAVAH